MYVFTKETSELPVQAALDTAFETYTEMKKKFEVDEFGDRILWYPMIFTKNKVLAGGVKEHVCTVVRGMNIPLRSKYLMEKRRDATYVFWKKTINDANRQSVGWEGFPKANLLNTTDVLLDLMGCCCMKFIDKTGIVKMEDSYTIDDRFAAIADISYGACLNQVPEYLHDELIGFSVTVEEVEANNTFRSTNFAGLMDDKTRCLPINFLSFHEAN